MVDEPQASGRWVRESDGKLVYVPPQRQLVVPVPGFLLMSVVLFGLASALALIPWFADDGFVLGVCTACLSASRQHRHWRSALAAVVVVGVVAGIGTGLVVRGLPHPWDEFLPFGIGGIAGNVAYAWVTGARSDPQQTTR